MDGCRRAPTPQKTPEEEEAEKARKAKLNAEKMAKLKAKLAKKK